MLARHPNCKSEWVDALTQWQSRQDISEKQWRFFAVIHKECLGAYPEEDLKTKGAVVPPVRTDGTDATDDIPF